MAEIKTIVRKCQCNKCNWVWTPRISGMPVRCPSCQTKLWNQEKKGENGNERTTK